MEKLTWKHFFDLSLLSYFDVYKDNQTMEELILSILLDRSLLENYKDDVPFQMNLASVWQMDPSEYRDVFIEEVFDDNADSGVYLYRLSWKGQEIIAIRGSEEADELTHKTNWQDWQDNFEMYTPGPTFQQLVMLRYVSSLDVLQPRYLCGHSKGGNLAIFSLMASNDLLFSSIQHVYSFNAPGITDSLLHVYEHRIQSNAFQEKVTLLENEHDCISSFFHHVKEPHLIASRISANSLRQLYENHQLHAMKFDGDTFAVAQKKSTIPRMVHHFINDFFVKLSPQRLERFVKGMDDYFQSGLSKSEMYRVLLYQISKYTNLFDELPYEEVSNINFQQLLERRRSKLIVQRIRELHPSGNVTMFIRNIKEENPLSKLGDLDVRKISDAILENYEATKATTSATLRHIVSVNNTKIMDAIQRIQDKRA